MRILVCDDEESQYKAAKSLIPDCHDVVGLCGAELTKALTDLFQTASRFYNDKDGSAASAMGKLAGHDLVFVDHDLSMLELDGAPLSAEGLIGYLRAFTDIPYIVSLNKNQDVDFDLRSLFGDDESLADLAINTDHLACKKLWQPAGRGPFAPWYWPSLPDAAQRRAAQIDFVRDRRNSPIWQELGFPDWPAITCQDGREPRCSSAAPIRTWRRRPSASSSTVPAPFCLGRSKSLAAWGTRATPMP